MWKVLLLLVTISFSVASQAQQLAFPSAEGYGRFSTGGRGGTVYTVTNLNSSGAGSLRECVDASGARTCVFNVSGVIDQAGLWQIRDRDGLNIAGQTAPGEGITLIRGGIRLRDINNVIIRHIRIRGMSTHPSMSSNDPCSHFKNARNIIWDHVSCSWSGDEVSDLWDGPHNITIQWSMITESLHCAGHPKGCHGKGQLVGGDGAAVEPYRISMIYNFIAHHADRVPFFKASTADYINNLWYNGGIYGQFFAKEVGYDVNFVGNYQENGPDTPSQQPYRAWGAFASSSDIYYNGNCDPVYRPTNTESQTASLRQGDGIRISGSRLNTGEILTYPSETDCFSARDMVLNNAGATKPVRDAVDNRVVLEYINGTGGIIDSEAQRGGLPSFPVVTWPAGYDTDGDGMPNAWELQFGLNPNSAADGPVIHANGYSNLENYLNFAAGDTVPGLTIPTDRPAQPTAP